MSSKETPMYTEAASLHIHPTMHDVLLKVKDKDYNAKFVKEK